MDCRITKKAIQALLLLNVVVNCGPDKFLMNRTIDEVVCVLELIIKRTLN